MTMQVQSSSAPGKKALLWTPWGLQKAPEPAGSREYRRSRTRRRDSAPSAQITKRQAKSTGRS